MMSEMAGDKGFLAIDNTAHTWVSKKHLGAWRTWLAHTFQGRSVPKVEAKAEAKKGKLFVTAKITSENAPVGVKLFYSYNKTTDWRASRWESTPMTPRDGAYFAAVDLKKDDKVGHYVEVEHDGKGGVGAVSSLVEVTELD